MNPSSFSPARFLKTITFAVVCLTALPELAEAKGPKHSKNDKGGKNKKHGSRDRGHDDRDRQVYISRPRSTFSLTFGNGYAGQGYYYGPSNSAYYYERSDVRYYANREAAPREYYGNGPQGSGSADASVQSALARRGYYNGPVDGAIGPQSRRSIARYQRDNGLRANGEINSNLLQSLGL